MPLNGKESLFAALGRSLCLPSNAGMPGGGANAMTLASVVVLIHGHLGLTPQPDD
jgi:hypothetical protein